MTRAPRPPSLRRVASLLALVAGLTAPACGLAVERANAKALVRDMQTLLGKHGIPPMGLSCQMQGTTRCGGCSVVLDAASRAKLVAALALAPATATPADAQHGACAVAPALHARSGLRVLEVDGRPKSLELQGGGAFTHLVLYVDEATGTSCLHVCYAYG